MIITPLEVKKTILLIKELSMLIVIQKNISQILRKPKTISCVFHFGEFARIYQSFLKMNECISSNSLGSNSVFNFCLKNKIKLIYSATSATLGNKGNDKNLSPYAFTKSKNLELLEKFKEVVLILNMKLFIFTMFMAPIKFVSVTWLQLLVFLKITLN